MAITGIPSIADGDIFTAAIWNALKAALEAKFTGAISGSDFTNPLKMIGDIDLNGNIAYNMPRLQGAYDLSLGSTVQTVFDNVNSDGGGMVYIPPGKTVAVNNVTVKGSNVMILGGGPSAQMILTGTPTRMFTTQGGSGNIWLHNLVFNGNSVAADGLQFADTDDVIVSHCRFIGFTQPAVTLTNNGAAGQTCKNVLFANCHFFGLTGRAFNIVDLERARFVNCVFYDGTGGAFVVNPATTSNITKHIELHGCRFKPANSATEQALIYKATSVTATVNQRYLTLKDCNFIGDGVTDGKAQVRVNDMDYLEIVGTKFRNSTTATPYVLVRHTAGGAFTAKGIRINDCQFTGLNGDAIALGHPGSGTSSGTSDIIHQFQVMNNYFEGIATGRSLIVNKPRFYNVVGNHTIYGGGGNDMMEFWGMTGSGGHALNGVFSNNFGEPVPSVKLFRTSTTGDGGTQAAIGTGSDPTAFAIFANNLVSDDNSGLSTSDVNVTTDTSVINDNNV